MYRQLACVGAECKTLYADKVANVEQLLEYGVVESRIAFGADIVTTDIDLNTACVVLQLEERCATHNSAAHHTSCDAYLLEVALFGVKFCGNLSCRSCHVVTCSGVGIDAE